MIHSAEVKALAALEANKLMSESLAGSITIGDMRIDDKSNIQYKNNDGSWTTIISPNDKLAVYSTAPKYVDFEGIYGKKIKEYIDKRIDEKLSELGNSKYKVVMGESD